ncbi:peptide-methionine (S)-S-oxide reductase MsrA [Sphingomonas sp. AX6]|uniref:peptide-methionine (S)-S-oxide reductase MsrA n=1 Tax=Sphingomonas sp. AX6 TaxID=2653171 RepID=UPI0012F11ACA|nr:peptide-methionine (S)-S-oxide reductase MsrA [Sphingomonas sp. AX6]VXC45383.1 Peptide methionine sulfoxide reductase MsrA 2 [Sphingomonas sp. AX6]
MTYIPSMKTILALGGAVALAAVALTGAPASERAVPIPAPKADVKPEGKLQTAVFAGGCFWGTEAVFEAVKGVRSVTSGYAGGTRATANYKQVAAETTDHAEAIRIVYDPAQVTYGTLLRIFFSVVHDPTQLNRQGPDVGRSYRSAIFPQGSAQTMVAKRYIAQLGAAKSFPAPIVTGIESGAFYPAEEYHQDFMRKNPAHPYILRWDKPKVAAFKAGFPSLSK